MSFHPKQRLLASVSFMPDASPGGVIATAMRHLAKAGPAATGMTMISPDGTVRYISRAEAEEFVKGSGDSEPKH
jgi:hypothetical protein